MIPIYFSEEQIAHGKSLPTIARLNYFDKIKAEGQEIAKINSSLEESVPIENTFSRKDEGIKIDKGGHIRVRGII